MRTQPHTEPDDRDTVAVVAQSRRSLLSGAGVIVPAMGDHFQTIVDLDATSASASGLASRALDWLIREGIARAERADCVLGAPLGHPPAGQWAKTAAEPGSGWEPTDGLSIQARRTVFFGGQGDAEYAACPLCTDRTRFLTEERETIDGTWAPFGNAINDWHASGQASVTCPSCALAS